MFTALTQDIRYGIRMMIKNPVFTVISVIALAIGIGANTAIFSVVNAVMLQPLPYENPGRLVHAFRVQPPITQGPISRLDYLDWQAQQKVFKEISAYYFNTFNITGTDEAERVGGVLVTENFFPMFGVSPAAGRFFLPEENQPGGGRVAVISYGIWQRKYGSDPGLVGKTVSLNGQAYTIVGVAPPPFTFPARSEIWTPAVLGEDKRQRDSNYLNVIGRLKDGVSTEQARAQMNQITAVLAQQYPESNTNLSVKIIPLLEAQVSSVRPMLYILLGAVAFVLLIACANVANLLLARATARQKEIALRTAIGATRWRITRQLLTESVLLSLLSSALGILLAMWGIHLLVSFAPATIPRITDIGLDRYVLGFTLLISLLTAVVFGLVPALQASKTDLNEMLKEGTRSASSGGKRRAALRRLLVVAEVALSFVLLVSAGLLIESIRRLSDVNPGFNTRNLLTARVSLPSDQSVADEQTEAGALKKVEKSARFLGEVQQRIAALPGVKTVGAINNLPVSGTSDVNGDFNIEGRPKFHAGEAPVAEFRLVTPGYFTAIGIPLLKGRTFEEGLRPQDELSVIINETLARQFFPGEDPIGKRLIVMDDKPHSIIGVVGDARQWSLDLPAAAEIYFPYSQLSFSANTTLVVRTTVEPASLGDTVRRAVRDVNRDAPVFGIRSMQEVLELSTAQRRFNTALITIFAGIALLLAIVGLYGVISYSFAQRTQEIGIRMALGAQAGSVLRMVLWFGLKLVLSGIAIGVVASFALTRVLASLLFGVSANDPITIVAGALFLTITALLASYIPARRATKVDPMVALRYE